jgi:hypothetical protein
MCEGGFACCEPVFFKTVLSRGPYCRAPYPIEWCGTCLWRVRASLCEEAGFPSHRVAPTPFSAGAQLSSRMRVRQAVVFNLTSASSIQLFISYHPHLDCDSRSLPLSLTWFVHSILHFLPSITAADSIRPAINHQSINRTPTRCDATTQQRAATLQGSGYGSELHLRSGQLQVLATTIRFFRYTTPSSRLKYSYNASQHKRDHHP